MTVMTGKPPGPLPELVPKYFDPDLIVTPRDNPVYGPASLADLAESIRQHGQLVPGWVCPSPELPEGKRLCLEGNRRLAVDRMLGLPFLAFDFGRFVEEQECIQLSFHHHQTRRVMSRDEMARRAARFMELTGCTQDAAAKLLNVSPAKLSRAFGDQRIPPELRQRADKLGLSIRSLIAAAPPDVMPKAVAFAETPGSDGKKPTRDEVSMFIRQRKKDGGRQTTAKPKAITLRLGSRVVTLGLADGDSAATVTEDLKSIVATLGKHANVTPEGWPFLFQ